MLSRMWSYLFIKQAQDDCRPSAHYQDLAEDPLCI